MHFVFFYNFLLLLFLITINITKLISNSIIERSIFFFLTNTLSNILKLKYLNLKEKNLI